MHLWAPSSGNNGCCILPGTMNRQFVLAALVMLFALPAFGQAPDTILINGKILTVDSTFSTREALAIREGKIQALGTTADIRKLASSSTRVVDLQGHTVI